MNLPFKTKFPWNEPTYFVEKITKGLLKTYGDLLNWEKIELADKYAFEFDKWREFKPKIHTIRPFSKIWKKDNNIHFFIWSGKPYHSKHVRFAPIVKCTLIQRVDIDRDHGCPAIWIDNKPPKVSMDEIAVNDGFRDGEQFFKWFNKPAENLQLRHWTLFKY